MKYIQSVLIMVFILGCDFEFTEVDEKFGKQNFVSAVSIIELHKVRNASYPETLSHLEFLGDWDQLWLSAVRYEKLEEGYNLFLVRGHMGKPKLKLPIEFKNRLGIKATNIEWVSKKD